MARNFRPSFEVCFVCLFLSPKTNSNRLTRKEKLLGRPAHELTKLLVVELDLPITAQEYQDQFLEEYFNTVSSQSIQLMPGADRLIRHLHRVGIPISVATSSNRRGVERNTNGHAELFDLFHHKVLAPEEPEIKRGKPDPATFLLSAKRFDPPPQAMENVLVFEDAPAGIEAARAAGMTSVWVPDHRVIDNHEDVHPTLKLDSLEDFQPELFGIEPF